jgi:2,4-dienoyl-CoA reductase [(3E)-enoyl-CoA-producing], peroxisomal
MREQVIFINDKVVVEYIIFFLLSFVFLLK